MSRFPEDDLDEDKREQYEQMRDEFLSGAIDPDEMESNLYDVFGFPRDEVEDLMYRLSDERDERLG